MRTIATKPVPTGLGRPAPREHRFIFALVTLLLLVAAVTGAVVIKWPGSTSHTHAVLTRVVGPETFVGSVYDEQVPKAPNPAQGANVVHTQVPPYLPMDGITTEPNSPQTGSLFHQQVPPYLPMDGVAETDVRGLDDDSAALTAAQQRVQK